jgi:hypothetical protein
MNRLKQLTRLSNVRGDRIVAVAVPIVAVSLLIEAYYRTDLRDAQSPSACAFAPTDRLIQSNHVRQLETDGIVVIPNAVGSEILREVRENLQSRTSNFEASGNDSDVRQDTLLFVRSEDSDDDNVGDDLSYCVKLLRGIANVLESHDYQASSNHTVPVQSQLAKYCGDGVAQYRRHLDRCSDDITELGLLEWLRLSDCRSRAVTCILYLNEPDRPAGEGGLLRCWMDHDEVLEVVPVGGTLVVFQSDRIEHMVLPSRTDRYALTSWVSGVLT